MNGRLRNEVIIGDAERELRRLPDQTVDMVLTSPPYFRLRDYQVVGQLGFEDAVDAWVVNVLRVTDQVRRVLTPTGTLWLNLGDSYATHLREGATRKSLLLGPERLALEMTKRGWLLRNKIVWAKTNPMPSSVQDRLTCGWEYLYLFSVQPTYFFDLDAIRVPHRSTAPTTTAGVPRGRKREAWRGPNGGDASGLDYLKSQGRVGHLLGKNPSDVWTIPSSNFRGAHHATFPIGLAQRAILAGCPNARCSHCRSPWQRPAMRSIGGGAVRTAVGPSCDCDADREPGLVLDPFLGAGTTAVVAQQHGRDWLGIELNPTFAALAIDRIAASRPLPAAHSPPAA